jgi:hypothetical protein
MTAAGGVRIERMTLQMPGVGRDDARRIAVLVAQALQQASPDLPGAPAGRGARIAVQARDGEQPAALAERIAGQIVATMSRAS